MFIIFVKTGDATIATVRDHCETVVEVLLGGDLRPVDTRQRKLYPPQPNIKGVTRLFSEFVTEYLNFVLLL